MDATKETMAKWFNPTLAALSSGGDVGQFGTNQGIADSQLKNNYLFHAEQMEREKLIAKLDQTECDDGSCSNEQERLDELNNLDKQRDKELLIACGYWANNANCYNQLLDLKAARQSYLDAGNSNDTWLTNAEFREIDDSFFDYYGNAATQAAYQALAKVPVDTTIGVLNLTDILGKAAAGDSEAKLQLRVMASEAKEFFKHPITETERQIREQLEYADRLESQGKLVEAENVRAGLFVDGALTVTTGVGGVAKSGLKFVVNGAIEPDPINPVGSNNGIKLTGAGTKAIQTISSPLPNGQPGAIWHGFGQPNARQQDLLDRLQAPGDTIVVPKGQISQKDLAALTAATGDEFAVFTTGGRRMIVRGGADNFGGIIDENWASARAAEGWRFSAHTHPIPDNVNPGVVMRSSEGDRAILDLFDNENSAIMGSNGARQLFKREGDW